MFVFFLADPCLFHTFEASLSLDLVTMQGSADFPGIISQLRRVLQHSIFAIYLAAQPEKQNRDHASLIKVTRSYSEKIIVK